MTRLVETGTALPCRDERCDVCYLQHFCDVLHPLQQRVVPGVADVADHHGLRRHARRGLEAGELLTSWTSDAPVNDIAIDSTGSTIAIAEIDGTITLRPLDGDEGPVVLAVVPGVEYVRWHPSERALAAVTVTSAGIGRGVVSIVIRAPMTKITPIIIVSTRSS